MEVKGTIEKIGETTLVTDKFQKREVVIVHGENPDYLDYNSFEFTQDKCDLLDNFKVGQEVEVSFNLRGRSWEDKKTGETKYFNSLNGWKINATGNTVSSATPKNKVACLVTAGGEDDDLPF